MCEIRSADRKKPESTGRGSPRRCTRRARAPGCRSRSPRSTPRRRCCPSIQGSGFRVQVAGFRVQGAGQGAGFRVQGLGCRSRSPRSRPRRRCRAGLVVPVSSHESATFRGGGGHFCGRVARLALLGVQAQTLLLPTTQTDWFWEEDGLGWNETRACTRRSLALATIEATAPVLPV